jgi:hypothetical protein
MSTITTMIQTRQIRTYVNNHNYDLATRKRDKYVYKIRKDKTLIYTNLHSVVTSPCGYSGK